MPPMSSINRSIERMSAAASALDAKWASLRALRTRIIAFVAELETRYKLLPPPFVRTQVGNAFEWDKVYIQHSAAVTKAANDEFMLGVFYNGTTNLSSGSKQCVATYSGWFMTQDEYNELNKRENMGALYGVEASALKTFVQANWDEHRWDAAWKQMDWVVVADPVSVAANINASFGVVKPSAVRDGLVSQRSNTRFSCDHRASLKVRQSDGRYTVDCGYMSVHKANDATIKPGDELFLSYGALIRDKLEQQQQNSVAASSASASLSTSSTSSTTSKRLLQPAVDHTYDNGDVDDDDDNDGSRQKRTRLSLLTTSMVSETECSMSSIDSSCSSSSSSSSSSASCNRFDANVDRLSQLPLDILMRTILNSFCDYSDAIDLYQTSKRMRSIVRLSAPRLHRTVDIVIVLGSRCDDLRIGDIALFRAAFPHALHLATSSTLPDSEMFDARKLSLWFPPTGIQTLVVEGQICLPNSFFAALSSSGIQALYIAEDDVDYNDDAIVHLAGGSIRSLDVSSCNKVRGKTLHRLQDSLERLSVADTMVSDLSLRHLVHLTHLNVSSCEKMTGCSFVHLVNLTVLNASHTSIQDLSLSLLVHLVQLDIAGCKKVTGDCFAHLEHLRHVTISDCRRISVAALGHLAHITTLIARPAPPSLTDHSLPFLQSIHTMAVSSIKRLTSRCLTPALHGIHSLDIAGISVPDSAPFIHLAGIHELDVSDTRIDDIGLSFLSGLHTLVIQGCPLVTGSLFAHLQTLQRLKADRTSITDAGLAHLTNLTNLSVAECPSLSDTAFVHTAATLRILNMSRNPLLTDACLLPLLNLVDLTAEDMSESLSQSAFLHLTSLESLRICAGRALFESCLTRLPSLKRIEVYCESQQCWFSWFRRKRDDAFVAR